MRVIWPVLLVVVLVLMSKMDSILQALSPDVPPPIINPRELPCGLSKLFTHPECRAQCKARVMANSEDAVRETLLEDRWACHHCPYWRGNDSLFSYVEAQQQTYNNGQWGEVLDAGTGVASAKWLAGLGARTTRWVAVTASKPMLDNVRREVGAEMRSVDELVIGNWNDESFLEGQTYDVIVADYLIGAVDGFAPYYQDSMLARLRRHLKPRGLMYIIAWQPYPHQLADNTTEGGRLVIEMAKVRDACITISKKGRAYREFPLSWTLRELEQAGYEIVGKSSHIDVYGPRFFARQLDVCRSYIPDIRMDDPVLADALTQRTASVQARAYGIPEIRGGLCFGIDYIVAARLK